MRNPLQRLGSLKVKFSVVIVAAVVVTLIVNEIGLQLLRRHRESIGDWNYSAGARGVAALKDLGHVRGDGLGFLPGLLLGITLDAHFRQSLGG